MYIGSIVWIQMDLIEGYEQGGRRSVSRCVHIFGVLIGQLGVLGWAEAAKYIKPSMGDS